MRRAMPVRELRPHQVEAVDAIVRALEPDPTSQLPARGLRTQVIMATGSGKTLVSVRAAERLRVRRVLFLVPSLDLLTQTVDAWRAGGWTGPVIGVSSLRGDEAGFPNTTDVDDLVKWTAGLRRVLVVATYASLGLGTLTRAHTAGLDPWDLVVVDEAHRVSGRIGKPWAVVHDNERIPAARRLFMTATPRLWQTGEDVEEQARPAGVEGELIAGMEDDPDGPFGAVCHRLSLSDAIDRGIVAPYQVVCVDVTDPVYQAAILAGEDVRSDAVRGARLAALQTALVKSAAQEDFTRTLVFHHLVREAEAFATGLPGVARKLWQDDPGRYPHTVRADWLHGAHSPAHRRRVLDAFAAGAEEGSGQGPDRGSGKEAGSGTEPRSGKRSRGQGGVAQKCFLSSVRVLGEGVDTRECDSVYFADVRGSMPDLVQAVGRSLRMRPGEGKVASLVVPVLLGPGETPETMLSSRSYDALAKLLEALRAHDARVVETLAEPQSPSRYTPVDELGETAGRAEGVSAAAAGLLKFSTPRDPAQLAAFIDLRVINPEHEHWRRGMEAAIGYVRERGDLRVPYGYRIPQGESGRPAALAGFPLGQWIADARRAHAAGRMDADRVARLDSLGMVWRHFDTAFEDGLAAVRGWAEEHGHALAPVGATWQGYPVGQWLHNQRAAARRAVANEARRAAGLPVPPSAVGELAPERRDALEEIDPSWCPAWGTGWQRGFRLTRTHLLAGGALPVAPGEVVVQGEDLGRWVTTQRRGWDKLTAAQRWLLEEVLGVEPPTERERPVPRTSRAQVWALNIAAARQFAEREGHLNVPRRHVEPLVGEDGREHRLGLGRFIDNNRFRAAALAPERRAELDRLGMRWS